VASVKKPTTIDERLIALAVNRTGGAKEVFRRVKDEKQLEGWENQEIYVACREVFESGNKKAMLLSPDLVIAKLQERGTYTKIGVEKVDRCLNGEIEFRELLPTIDAVIGRRSTAEIAKKLEELESAEKKNLSIDARAKLAGEVAKLHKAKAGVAQSKLLSLDDWLACVDTIEEMPPSCPTGFELLDERLGGGLPKGAYSLLVGHTGTGKHASLDTKIPCPSGFITMRDVKIGDTLFDEQGKHCTVKWKSEVVTDIECYRITFDTGESVTVSESHLWQVMDRYDRWTLKNRNVGKVSDWRDWWEYTKTLSTKQMLSDGVRKNGGRNFSIPLTKSITGNSTIDNIDPYVFGYWLGDGDSTSSTITVHKDDIDSLLKNIPERYKISITKPVSKGDGYNALRCNVSGLLREVKELGLDVVSIKSYKKIVKRIPMEVLRSNHETRLSVLQGIMDSDGWNQNNTNTVYLTMANKELIDDCTQLIASLGMKPRVKHRFSSCNGKQFDSWVISFAATENIFRLERKRSLLGKSAKQQSRHTQRLIDKIESVGCIPCQCLEVDSPSHCYLIGETFIPTHNTIQMLSWWKRMLDRGAKSIYINYEIDRDLFMKFMFAQFTACNVMKRNLNKDFLQMKKLEFIEIVEDLYNKELLLLADPKSGSSKMWSDIEGMLRDLVDSTGSEFIFFDTINSVYAATGGERHDQYELVANESERFCLETGVGILYSAQPKQEAITREDKRPQLMDVGGSRTLSEKAASVVHLHRTDKLDPERKIEYSELYITKNRVIGDEMGDLPIRIKYDNNYKRLYELPESEQGDSLIQLDTLGVDQTFLNPNLMSAAGGRSLELTFDEDDE
jgi:replicative DNA helicase